MIFTILGRPGAGTDPGSNIRKLLIHIALLFKDILNVSFYFGDVEIKYFYFLAFVIIVGVWVKIIRSIG